MVLFSKFGAVLRLGVSYWNLLAWSPYTSRGFPGGSVVKNPPAKCRRCGLHPWVGNIPWSKKWQPTPVFVPGKFHRHRSLADYSPWGRKESERNTHTHTHTHTHTRTHNASNWKSVLKLRFRCPSKRLKDFCCCFSFQAYVGQLCKCGYDFFMEFILSGFNKDLYHVSVAYKLNCFAGMLFPSIFAVYSPCWFLIVNA